MLQNILALEENKMEFSFCSIFTISHMTFLNQYFILFHFYLNLVFIFSDFCSLTKGSSI